MNFNICLYFMILCSPALDALAGESYVSARYGLVLNTSRDVDDGTITGVDLATGSNMSFAYGEYYDDFRLEFEYDTTSQDVDSVDLLGRKRGATGSFETQGLFINVDYAPDYGVVSPFIGVGAGFNEYDFTVIQNNRGRRGVASSQDDVVFAYRVRGGMLIDLNEKLSMELSYQYQDGQDPEGGGASIDPELHSLRAGAVFKF